MDDFPKSYSFDWWLALYDKANTKKWEYTVSISKGNEDAIPKYTQYAELAKWIRQRLYLNQYNKEALRKAYDIGKRYGNERGFSFDDWINDNYKL